MTRTKFCRIASPAILLFLAVVHFSEAIWGLALGLVLAAGYVAAAAVELARDADPAIDRDNHQPPA